MDKQKMLQEWQRLIPYIFHPLTIGIVIILVLLILIFIPKWQAPHYYLSHPRDIFAMENEARKTIAYIIGGILVIVGIGLTIWRNWIAQEGNITERFYRAIEQLAGQRDEQRLGGIYSLERISKESESDYWPIIEIISAYIRRRAPWNETSSTIEKARPNIDIQAALTVLCQRKHYYGNGESDQVDLRQIDLRGAYFQRKTHLERAILFEAHLERAMLLEARLEGANLMNSYLEHAILTNAHLEGAILDGAHLDGTNLDGVGDLTEVQAKSAASCKGTIWPAHLKAKMEGWDCESRRRIISVSGRGATD